MLVVVVGDNQQARHAHITSVLPEGATVTVFDDTQGVLGDLEHYLYPSLFVEVAPVIHVKYMLNIEPLASVLVKQMIASPTLFVFEEIEVGAGIVPSLKKAGAVIYTQEKSAKPQKPDDIFAVTGALTAPDKKKRWMIYRDALATHPIEAIIGILYWKVRDLALKSPKEKVKYLQLYRDLLTAHASSWQSGTPLELGIEKVLLAH